MTQSTPPRQPLWQFWIDRGGTFTDVVGRAPDGALRHPQAAVARTPSSTATRRSPASATCSGSKPASRSRRTRVECVKMGTTVATNALLERKGEPTLLVTTRGFRDALRIAYQDRPRLFDRHIVLPELLYERVIEAHERVGARRRRASSRWTRRTCASDLQAAFDAGLRSGRDRLHARLPLHRRTSGARPRWRARSASRRSACRTRSAR